MSRTLFLIEVVHDLVALQTVEVTSCHAFSCGIAVEEVFPVLLEALEALEVVFDGNGLSDEENKRKNEGGKEFVT